MKKVFAIVLMMALMLSISAVAFADASPSGGGDEYYGAPTKNVDLSKIPLISPIEVPDGVDVVALAKSSADLQDTAKNEVIGLENQGYIIDAGCVLDGPAGTQVEVKLPPLKDNQRVFVNGAAVEVSANNTIVVTLLCIILIVH